MFNTLEEKIEEAEGTAPSKTKQFLCYFGSALAAALILCGLYMAIRLL